ncbi:MAG: carbohydrate kinase family protein [Propionibacteriaceae bacterium]|jgi:sugar/nucleoside kinase (ribokinase family)|nr:carbohydrate kinase family protein [Propionibacteriaceae bacterium]
MARIVGLGTLAMDVLVGVDRLPGRDGFAVVTSRAFLPGGSGTNVICQAARLGADCAFLGKVGDDALGAQILASLRSEGVDVSGMRTLAGGTSLSTTVVVDAAGDRFILLDLGDAFAAFTADEVDLAAIEAADVFYTDLAPRDAALAGVHAARRAGVPVVFGLETGLDTMRGLGVTTEDILDVAADAVIFLPCREGLADLAGSDDLEDGLRFLESRCHGVAVVTLGGDGVVAVAGGERIRIPGTPVAAVDTTGAGDAFAGALLASCYVDGLDLPDALRLANAVAADSCTRRGARSGPDRARLAEFSTQTTKE